MGTAAVSAIRRHTDAAHHHPRVHRGPLGTWSWVCSCGGAACRTSTASPSWRQALVEALSHSTRIAA